MSNIGFNDKDELADIVFENLAINSTDKDIPKYLKYT